MRLSELLLERTVHTPTWEKSVGVEWVNVPFSVTKEEQDQFDELGISLPKWGVPVKGTYKVPIAYAYTLNMKNNKDLMDAIKMRNPDHVMPTESVRSMIRASISDVVSANPKSIDRLSHYKQSGLNLVQNMLRGGKKVIISTMPSSSPLSKMIADELSDMTGAARLDVFEKHHFPRQSKFIRSLSKGFSQREVNRPSPADLKTEWESSISKAMQQINDIEQRFDDGSATEDDLNAYEQLSSKVEQLQKQLRDYKFEKKKQYDPQDRGRGFYGYIEPTPEGQKLNKAYVILVDDNVITGETVAEAIKSLLRNKILPVQIAGFAVHKYYSSAEELQSQQNTDDDVE